MKKRKPKFISKIGKLKIEYKDDPITLHYLLRFILLAEKLADVEDKDEIERIQKDFLENY